MYTQCPECQSYFRITPAQIKAREGLVRCGRCHTVFRAGDHLMRRLPSGSVAEPDQPKARERTRKRRSRKRQAAADSGQNELFTFRSLPGEAGQPQQRILWGVLGTLLVIILAGQLVYLNSIQLVRHADLRPWMEMFCQQTGCALKPPPDVARVELETSIAPHPRYVNALRIRADLVNRADHAQPMPRMEVTLTDSEGRVIARRIFAPQNYLPPRTPVSDMLPNIVVRTLLDVTNPENRAVGYEIRLLPHDG